MQKEMAIDTLPAAIAYEVRGTFELRCSLVAYSVYNVCMYVCV